MAWPSQPAGFPKARGMGLSRTRVCLALTSSPCPATIAGHRARGACMEHSYHLSKAGSHESAPGLPWRKRGSVAPPTGTGPSPREQLCRGKRAGSRALCQSAEVFSRLPPGLGFGVVESSGSPGGTGEPFLRWRGVTLAGGGDGSEAAQSLRITETPGSVCVWGGRRVTEETSECALGTLCARPWCFIREPGEL